jgi:hypothetical protein
VFQTIYDGLDRVIEEKQPDLINPTTLVTKTAYQYTDSPLPASIRRTDYLNSGTSTDLYKYLDGFGRTIQERKSTETFNLYSVKDYVYDSRGLLSKESLPYLSSGASHTMLCGDPLLL